MLSQINREFESPSLHTIHIDYFCIILYYIRMKNIFIILALFFSIHTHAFMSGLDDRRDTHGSLEIVGAYIPLGPEGMVNAGYMKLNNTSDSDITLHYITSPVYDAVQIHSTIQKNGVAKMVHAKNLVVPAKGSVALEPGGSHLMLMGPRRNIKEGDEIVGNETRVKVIKNKVAPPFKQAEFQIMYGTGIYRLGEIIDLGVQESLVDKAGAWYSYKGDRIGQGKKNAAAYLNENLDMAAEIDNQLRAKLLGDTEARDEEIDNVTPISST